MSEIDVLRKRVASGESIDALHSELVELAPPRTRPGDARALLLLDLILELRARSIEASALLVEPWLTFLESIEPRELPVAWLAEGTLGESGVIYTRSLDDVLDAPDLRAAGHAIARLISTLRITSYFHEILVEAIARDTSEDASCFLTGAAALRAYRALPWSSGRAFLFCLVERVREAKLPALEWNPPPIQTLRWNLAWRRLVEEGGGGLDALRLATAQWAIELAPLKAREIVASLERRREPWWRELRSEDAEPVLEAAFSVTQPDRLMERVAEIVPAVARGEVAAPLALLGWIHASERMGDAALPIATAPTGSAPR